MRPTLVVLRRRAACALLAAHALEHSGLAREMDNLPPAQAKKASWMKTRSRNFFGVICTHCFTAIPMTIYQQLPMDFCPNCGCEMDTEEHT